MEHTGLVENRLIRINMILKRLRGNIQTVPFTPSLALHFGIMKAVQTGSIGVMQGRVESCTQMGLWRTDSD
jgi:hypothetical protein